MLGVGEYLWRLIPGNPILLRVVGVAGKRRRDLLFRCGYLGLLVLIVCVSLAVSGSQRGGQSLSDLSVASQRIFAQMSLVQLALVALLAPVFTAGAITQERDSQTYEILLATPLDNAQIVLGTLLSRFFFVLSLLVSGIPIFSVTQIFGGVAIRDIVMAFLIAGTTALITGSLAIAIASLKVGTRRTIFGFYLFTAVYLIGGVLLDRLPYFHIDGARAGQRISWFTGVNPFLALRVSTDPGYGPPDLAALPPGLRDWPLGWYLTRPQWAYVSVMATLSALLVLPSIALLRRLAQASLTPAAWLRQRLHIGRSAGARTPRAVWQNPVAWREARTRASAARSTVLRYLFALVGVSAATGLLVAFSMRGAAPAKFITPESYNPALRTLFIQGDSTYVLSESLQITLDGEPADAQELLRYHEVLSAGTTLTAQGARRVVSLALARVPRVLEAAPLRRALLGLILLEFAVILLVVTNAAASAVTREKEDGTLDLLLTTPITSRYYLWGKFRGLLAFAAPLLAVPLVSVLVVVVADLARRVAHRGGAFEWLVFPEAVLVLPTTMLTVTALAALLGMSLSLRLRTTVAAVMSSVGALLAICALLGYCGSAALFGMRAEGPLAMALASLSPFNVLALLIDPWTTGGRTFIAPAAGEVAGARIAIVVFAWLAAGGYAVVLNLVYRAMVRNFDMTIRRQAR